MFLLPRRQIWTQQPQGLVGLSDDVAEYSPVFATVLGSDNRNIVNGQSPSSLVNTKGVGAAGVGLQGDTTASGGRASYAVQTRGKQLTIVVTVTPGSYVTSLPMLLETDAASASYSEGSFFLLPYYRYSGVQPNYWSLAVNPSEGGSTGYATALIPSPVAGKPHTLVIRMDRALGGFAVIRDVHIDGVKQALSIDDGIPLLEQIPAGSHWNSNNLYINSRSGNSLYGNHLVHAAALFAANPSESVARQWSENPWQIFKRPDSHIFVPVSAGGGTTSLIVQDATHAHIADSPSFSMATYLAVAESLHAHAADNVTLATTGTANLVVQEATHAHVADGVSLTTQWLLAVAEALHSHTAESVTLSLQTALVVLEALHSHAAENLTLGVTGTANLTIADATSGHTSDTVALTLNSLLAVFDAIHAHAADSLTLDTSNATALTVQDSTHAHGADSLGLSLDTWLAIVEAAHGHTADAPTLSTALALQVAESLHAHYADVVVLGFPSAPGSGPTVEEIVAAVLAALNATTIPVDVHKVLTIPVTGNWPTANENADALLARNWP